MSDKHFSEEEKVAVYHKLGDIYEKMAEARDHAQKVYQNSWKEIGKVIFSIGGSVDFKMSNLGRQAAEFWAKYAGTDERMREHFLSKDSQAYLRELRYSGENFVIERGVYWSHVQIESIRSDAEGNVTIVVCDPGGARCEKKPDEIFANMCPSDPFMFTHFITKYIFD